MEGKGPRYCTAVTRSDHLRKIFFLCLLLFISPSPGTMAMKQASLGHWKSPISSELITSKVRATPSGAGDVVVLLMLHLLHCPSCTGAHECFPSS